MTGAAALILRGRRHPDETRVGLRTAATLVAVLVAALGAAGVLLAHSVRQQNESRVAAHLGVVLQAAVSEAAQEAAQAQEQAAALAADRRLQRALAAHDGAALARLTASVPGAEAAAGPAGVAGSTRPSLRREVHVLSGGRVVGTVAVTVPLDGAALARLRAAAPLGSGEGLLLVRGRSVIGGPATLAAARIDPRATSARLDGAGFRVAQTRLLAGVPAVRLAALAPASEIDGPVGHAERLLAVALLTTFAALLLLANVLARPALAPLARLAREARSSSLDELTALRNRRGFTEAAVVEAARARRTGRPLAVAMVDLDDFKRVNDTYGHPEGDRVLRGLADVLRDHFREVDVTARLGGEEFAVLLPETDVAGAYDAAERFLVALAEHDFGGSHPNPHGITASVGVAAGRELPVETLLASADDALYRAKANGKNQVQVAGAAAPG